MSDIFSRRDVIKQGAVVVGGISFLGLAACTGDKGTAKAPATNATAPAAGAAPSGDPLISVDHPTAKQLKYVHDGSTVDAAIKVEKSGVAGADQSCANCQFYKQVDGKDYGSCTLIPVPGKHVAAKGWCVTWAKKS